MASGENSNAYLRRIEKKLGLFGLLFFLDPLLAFLIGFPPHYSFIIGYYLGYSSFIVLCETFIATQKKPIIMAIMLFLANIKLLLIGFIIWLLNKYGFSAIEAIIGVFIAQSSVIIMILTLAKTNKNKEKL